MTTLTCLDAPFSGDPYHVETGTLTCYVSRWAGLYMLWFFMLEGIFERTIRPGFAEIFQCHCHLQYQICFGLGDGQDTEEFSNIWGVFGMLSLFLYKSMFLDDFRWGLVSCEDE